MKELKIKLPAKFAERLIKAAACQRGWQPTIPNPKRKGTDNRVVIPNPITAEDFLQEALLQDFKRNLVVHESREHILDIEISKREELEKELKG